MSFYFDQIKKDPLAKEINPEESKFSGRRSEGEPYLFFGETDIEPLHGRELKYYENGVLLVLRDKYKPFSNSKHFAFFSNKGVEVFSRRNTEYQYNFETRTNTPITPKFDMEIQITQHYVHVVETDLETKEDTEYYVNIASGKKLFDIFEKQTTNDLSL